MKQQEALQQLLDEINSGAHLAVTKGLIGYDLTEDETQQVAEAIIYFLKHKGEENHVGSEMD